MSENYDPPVMDLGPSPVPESPAEATRAPGIDLHVHMDADGFTLAAGDRVLLRLRTEATVQDRQNIMDALGMRFPRVGFTIIEPDIEVIGIEKSEARTIPPPPRDPPIRIPKRPM